MTRLATAVLPTATLLLSTACTSQGDVLKDRAAARQKLLTRPTLEAERARLTTLRDEIRDALSDQLGRTGWTDMDKYDDSTCGDVADLAGTRTYPSSLALRPGLRDERWPAAVRVISDVARRGGFRPPETAMDKPGEHEVALYGERQSVLRFGAGPRAVTLSLQSGCHLPAADHHAT